MALNIHTGQLVADPEDDDNRTRIGPNELLAQLGATPSGRSALSGTLNALGLTPGRAQPQQDDAELAALGATRQELLADRRYWQDATRDNPFAVLGSIIGQRTADNRLRENTAAMDARRSALAQAREAQDAARAKFAEENPEFAQLLSADPAMREVGGVVLRRAEAERGRQHELDMAETRHRRQQEAARLAQAQRLAAAEAKEHNRRTVLSADGVRSGLQNLDKRLKPLNDIYSSFERIDRLIRPIMSGTYNEKGELVPFPQEEGTRAGENVPA